MLTVLSTASTHGSASPLELGGRGQGKHLPMRPLGSHLMAPEGKHVLEMETNQADTVVPVSPK